MNTNNKLNIILAAGLIFNYGLVFAQSSGGPDNNQRFTTSMTQITAALSIQHGITNDPNCKGKKYTSITVDDYVDFIAAKDEKDGKSPKTKAEKDELMKTIGNVININIPGKGPIWRETYNLMMKNIINYSQLYGEALCDSLNGTANSLYQKSMDNLRLMK